MAGLKELAEWCGALQLPWRRWRIVGCVDSGDAVPETLRRRGVVLVGTAQRPTWAAFDCPCGSGHRLLVNLNSRQHPHWQLDSGPRLSLRPSIDSITGDRRCHFVMEKGRVRWVPSG